MMKQLFSVLTIFVLLFGVSAQGVTLLNYQDAFTDENNQFRATIVVGEDARPSDTLSALRLANALRNQDDGSSTGSGESEDVSIGSSLSTEFDQELTNSDIEGLIDANVDFQGEDYDVSESIILGQGANDVSIQSSLTSGDDDYQTDIVMEVERDSIKYYYNFDDSIDLGDATEDEPIEIEFLGRTIQIVDVDSDTSFTALVGQEYVLDVNEEVTIEGVTIKLLNVGATGSVSIEVNGERETIPEGATETVGGIEINNHETFYTEEIEGRSASLIIGDDAMQTYEDGDEFIGEPEDDPRWVWNIGNLLTTGSSNPSALNDGTGPFIGIENDFIYNDESDNPPGIGGEITLPFNYIAINLEKFTVADADYAEYTFRFEDSEDLSDALGDAFTGEPTVFISTNEDEGLVLTASNLDTQNVTGNIETRRIWLHMANATTLNVLYYDEDENDVALAGTITTLNSAIQIGEINFGDTTGNDIPIGVNFNPAGSELNIVLDPTTSDVTDDDITMNFGIAGTTITGLGGTASQEEADELVWNTQNIGTKDNDLRTKYGIIINEPESSGSEDEVVLQIPEDEVKATVSVFGQGSGTSTDTTNDGTSGTNNWDETPEIRLDTELTPRDTNLILIGGPAVNSKVAQLLQVRYPTYGTTEEFDVNPGEALIRLIEEDGENYLIIAGYNQEDTEKAVEVMSNPNSYRNLLQGRMETVISVESIDSIGGRESS